MSSLTRKGVLCFHVAATIDCRQNLAYIKIKIMGFTECS